VTAVVETGPAQHGLTGHSHIGGRTAAKPDSHLHGAGSADLADHPVPSGREENWRFTPMRRLRGLEADAPFQGVIGEDNDTVVEAPAGVIVRRVIGDEAAALKGEAGQLPTDRPSARAWAASSTVLMIDVPAQLEVTEPVVITFLGTSASKATAGHVIVRVGRDATVRHTALTFGGDLVRVVGTVSYDGPGGDAELTGLYFADAGQHLEHRLFVDHEAPN